MFSIESSTADSFVDIASSTVKTDFSTSDTVSYTHLDVYKRQRETSPESGDATRRLELCSRSG